MLYPSNWSNPKPKPRQHLDSGYTWVKCGRCGGCGIYAQAVVNGQPWSPTGTQCWGCGGLGWKARKLRRQRCPHCQALVYFQDGQSEPHGNWKLQPGNTDHPEGYYAEEPCTGGQQ